MFFTKYNIRIGSLPQKISFSPEWDGDRFAVHVG